MPHLPLKQLYPRSLSASSVSSFSLSSLGWQVRGCSPVYLKSRAPQGDLWAEDEDMPDGTYARSGDASFTPEAVVS